MFVDLLSSWYLRLPGVCLNCAWKWWDSLCSLVLNLLYAHVFNLTILPKLKLALAFSASLDFSCLSDSSISLLLFQRLNKLFGIIKAKIVSLLAIFLSSWRLLAAPLKVIVVISSFLLKSCNSLFSSLSRFLQQFKCGDSENSPSFKSYGLFY